MKKFNYLNGLAFLLFFYVILTSHEAWPDDEKKVSEPDQTNLPHLDSEILNYRTPRAGEGFKTKVFGEDIIVPSRNLRSVTGWKLGAQIETPQPDDRLALPAAALYVWQLQMTAIYSVAKLLGFITTSFGELNLRVGAILRLA